MTEQRLVEVTKELGELFIKISPLYNEQYSLLTKLKAGKLSVVEDKHREIIDFINEELRKSKKYDDIDTGELARNEGYIAALKACKAKVELMKVLEKYKWHTHKINPVKVGVSNGGKNYG